MDNMLIGLRSFLDRSERKEFEAHAKTRGYTLFTRAYHPNHYDDDIVEEMWLSWLQAKKLLLRDIETYLATISRE